MPTPRQSAVPVRRGTPARVLNADRAHRVSRRLLDLAARGPEYCTALEGELRGLGTTQLREVVTDLWTELARKEIRRAD